MEEHGFYSQKPLGCAERLPGARHCAKCWLCIIPSAAILRRGCFILPLQMRALRLCNLPKSPATGQSGHEPVILDSDLCASCPVHHEEPALAHLLPGTGPSPSSTPCMSAPGTGATSRSAHRMAPAPAALCRQRDKGRWPFPSSGPPHTRLWLPGLCVLSVRSLAPEEQL